MKENGYYKEIKNVIEELEVNNELRVRKDNSDRVKAYWEIGKQIVEAQGGKEKAKYGNELIKKWSNEFTKLYGDNYSERSIRRMRQFYIEFPKWSARHQLTWTHYKLVLSIKNENERNFYLNKVIEENLSSRELEKLIKNKAFDKLSPKEKNNVKLIEKDNIIIGIESNNEIIVPIDDRIKNERYYFDKINEIIEKLEIEIKVRKLKEENEKIRAYWEIGELLIKVQGGKEKSDYGNKLIKSWSIKLTKTYGNGYNETNLKRFRKFYTLFPNWNTLCSKLTWTHYKLILPIKNENERNYYINQVNINSLTSRELEEEIKNKAFDRLSYADKENIELIENNNYTLTIGDMIKDPIIIRIDEKKINEKTLHRYIIDMLENKFLELGLKFTLAGHEYKVRVDKHTYKLDLLFFNVKLNAYVVLELKVASMKVKDVDQVKFYTSLVDKYVKEDYNNTTIGLLITKEHDDFTIKYASEKDIFTTRYKLVNKTQK